MSCVCCAKISYIEIKIHKVKCKKWTNITYGHCMLVVKNPLANEGHVRELGSIPGSGRSPGGGHNDPLQYSDLENPMDGVA